MSRATALLASLALLFAAGAQAKPHAIIRYHRSGGFAGVDQRLVIRSRQRGAGLLPRLVAPAARAARRQAGPAPEGRTRRRASRGVQAPLRRRGQRHVLLLDDLQGPHGRRRSDPPSAADGARPPAAAEDLRRHLRLQRTSVAGLTEAVSRR